MQHHQVLHRGRPEHITITDNAIIPLKERVADTRYDSIAWLGGKIRRRGTSMDGD